MLWSIHGYFSVLHRHKAVLDGSYAAMDAVRRAPDIAPARVAVRARAGTGIVNRAEPGDGGAMHFN